MSKSLKRVVAVLEDAGLGARPVEMTGDMRTARQAAEALDCALDQIAKSILFRGADSGRPCLFITAGGNRVDPVRAAQVAGEPLERADAAFVRRVTGFAIGDVAPIGHLTPPRAFLDPRLLDFATVWPAAGTPRHLVEIAPRDLSRLAGAETAPFTVPPDEM